MAKKWAQNKKEPGADYGAELKKLRRDGPGRVYILRGEEDYLRDSFLEELKNLCLDQGGEAFNYHRLQGPALDMDAFRQSVDAMPFMGERTLVEVRDMDVDRIPAGDVETFVQTLTDVPDWTTVAFVFDPEYEMDGRLKAVKTMKKAGADLAFGRAGDAVLARWVMRRVESLDKTIDYATAHHLIEVCGNRMNGLIPEITKIVGYARGGAVTEADIDAVAKKAPETTIFNLINALGAKRYDDAAGHLANLLADRDEPPPRQLAMVSAQFRQLYVVRVALDSGQSDEFITACLPELTGRTKMVYKLKKTAENFSADRLARAVEMCVRCDHAMKDTGGDKEVLMKELLLRLAMDRP